MENNKQTITTIADTISSPPKMNNNNQDNIEPNNQTITTTTGNITPTTAKVSPAAKNTLLILNCILLTIGTTGGPLITRLYFTHGGNRFWLSSFLQTAGFPFIMIVLIILYFHRRGKHGNQTTPKLLYIRYPLLIAAAIIGLIMGLSSYFYSSGASRLPVSTSSLIASSQLVFTSFFAFVLVRQKFTQYSINAVVLLTVGAGELALHSSSDRPEGESKKMYVMGFVMMLAAAATVGLMLPLVELMYNKAKQEITYTLVLEIQMVICFFGTIFCLVGMIANNDFKVIPREAREFDLGITKYCIILCASTLVWQCSFLGIVGVIFCVSSLLSGIIISFLLPITEVLAIIFFKEKFQAEKGVALILSIWGFASYFYGEYKFTKKLKSKPKLSPRSIDIDIGQANV